MFAAFTSVLKSLWSTLTMFRTNSSDEKKDFSLTSTITYLSVWIEIELIFEKIFLRGHQRHVDWEQMKSLSAFFRCGAADKAYLLLRFSNFLLRGHNDIHGAWRTANKIELKRFSLFRDVASNDPHRKIDRTSRISASIFQIFAPPINKKQQTVLSWFDFSTFLLRGQQWPFLAERKTKHFTNCRWCPIRSPPFFLLKWPKIKGGGVSIWKSLLCFAFVACHAFLCSLPSVSQLVGFPRHKHVMVCMNLTRSSSNPSWRWRKFPPGETWSQIPAAVTLFQASRIKSHSSW